jgi:selenocysteine lyase/cysteine desulfurase
MMLGEIGQYLQVWLTRRLCRDVAAGAETGYDLDLIDETHMLPSQRDLFDIPRNISYLNSASYSPLPLRTQQAGRAAIGRKATPWTLDAGFANGQHERARLAAATLIRADPADIALIPSISYGVATAAKLVTIARGTRVLVLENDHSSPVLEWLSRAEAQGFVIETVRQPDDGDWTSAVLAAVERPGAPPVGLASISSVHWSDGGLIHLERVGAALRRHGAIFLVDATHSAGVLTIDVKRLDPDFVIFPTYKWLLGPYGRAFLYVARRRQDGIPLEQTSFGRRDVRSENAVYFADTRYVPDARRFDMGERDHFISIEMAAIGMEMMAAWGASAIEQRLSMLTERIAEGVRGTGVGIAPRHLRAPHILSLGFARPGIAGPGIAGPGFEGLGFMGGMPAGLVEGLAAEGIYVAARLGRMRISPHVFNDEADADRFVAALAQRLRG